MNEIIPQGDAMCIPNTAGIYKIVNITSQHFYVGSAVNLLRRKTDHFRHLKAQTHKNDHLQRAYDLYGSNAFVFIVIEHVENPENLLEREQHYIDNLDPQYNICRTAGSNLGMEFTPEHRAKISAARRSHPDMIKHMQKLNADRTGKKLSPEHKAKITANQIGREKSPETRSKMSAAHKGKKKSPEHAANISKGKMGHNVSPETIEKTRTTKRDNHNAKLVQKLDQQGLSQPPLF